MTEFPLPVISRTFPLALTSLHQLEITSRCNLRCKYCPSPNLERPKLDMTLAAFERALEHVRYYVATSGQVELNLAGIGESTIHPDFVRYLELAREAVGQGVQLTLATNGLTAAADDGEALVEAMIPYRPCVWVSLHRPELARIAVKRYRKAGLLVGYSADPSINSNDWAGQVSEDYKPEPHQAPMPCTWLRDGRAMVLADGRVTACCLDASGKGVIGHVDDEIGSLRTRPYSLCRTCHHDVSVAGYDQRA
jgi:hypothetical protein